MNFIGKVCYNSCGAMDGQYQTSPEAHLHASLRTQYSLGLSILWVRYFGNLSNIDDRVRNISWQTINLTQTLTLTLILTLILTLTLTICIHTYTRPSMLDRLQKQCMSLTLALDCYSDHGTSSKLILNVPTVTELLNFTCQFLTSIYYNSHRRQNDTEIVGCKQIRILYRPCKI